MTPVKATIILITFCICGLLFCAIGLYFKSKKYLGALQEASATPEKANFAKAACILCGNISIGLGGFTIICGIITKLMPELFSYLALTYVIVLIVAFLIIIGKTSNGEKDKH
ncbi:MAG: hypothetical protein II110_09295 [Treponema sp.]|nr:hypothetical protein [Treponema sp.]MBQ5470956.1 hypothetical protein [Treponema sp.]